MGKISLGQLFENSIFQNLRPFHQLNFFSEKQKEVDFIIDNEIGLEVKLTPSKKDFYLIEKRKKQLSLSQSYVVSLTWNDNEKVVLSTDL